MNGSPIIGLPRVEAGYLLLDLLGLDGWEISIVASPLGVEVRATGFGDVVTGQGQSVPEVSLWVFETCRRISRSARACPA